MKKAAQIIIFKTPPSPKEKLFFTKHLATMLNSGVPLSDALQILLEQQQGSNLKGTIKQLLSDVDNGLSFQDALAKHPKIFDNFYLNLVKVGEESGKLAENLDFLAKQMTKKYNLRKKIQGALLYPIIVLSVAIIIGGFIAFFILPKLLDFFIAFSGDLPLSTRILLFIAALSRDYGLLIVLGIFFLLVIFILSLRNQKMRLRWHRNQLKVPLFGNLLKYNQLSAFCRNLGTLLASGAPAMESLEALKKTTKNLLFKQELDKIKDKVSAGEGIAQAMLKSKADIFPPLLFKMLEVGEKTGNLADSLLYLADYYEEEIDTASQNLSQLLEPILLLSIGLIVGFLALAIISPIYQLTSQVGR